MAAAPISGSSSFTLSQLWLLTMVTLFFFGFLGHVVYDAIMATATELLKRLLVISPLLLVVVVHLLSTGSTLMMPSPMSEPGAIHRAGGSPWGLAFVLLLLFFLVFYRPSLYDLLFN